jgi:hypothetical protein
MSLLSLIMNMKLSSLKYFLLIALMFIPFVSFADCTINLETYAEGFSANSDNEYYSDGAWYARVDNCVGSLDCETLTGNYSYQMLTVTEDLQGDWSAMYFDYNWNGGSGNNTDPEIITDCAMGSGICADWTLQCGNEEPVATTTIDMTATVAMLGTLNFGIGIIITLLFVIIIGFIFNNINQKAKTKKW